MEEDVAAAISSYGVTDAPLDSLAEEINDTMVRKEIDPPTEYNQTLRHYSRGINWIRRLAVLSEYCILRLWSSLQTKSSDKPQTMVKHMN